MELVEEATEEMTVVAVAGRLDTRSAGQFSSRLDALLEAGQIRLLIEASGLRYISSVGLRALLVASRVASDKGGQLALYGMSPAVRQVVELTGLAPLFNVCNSREEGVAHLSHSNR